MRKLDRRERAALGALANALDHEPALRPLVVEDYYRAAKARRVAERRLSELTFAPGKEDPTGFAPGCTI